MASNPLNFVLQDLRRSALRHDGDERTNSQLLEAFLRSRDPLALEVLVQRHAPMVWGVCRRTLANDHEAEDAFQATFLVLLRRAASLRAPELLSHWLSRVAYQTARKARQRAVLRGAREKQVKVLPETPPEPPTDTFGLDLREVFDEELRRLPKKYQSAIVLCVLEGKTRPEAARQLGLPEGTVASRLAKGRSLLARRLLRRGLGVSATGLAAAGAQQAASAAVPAALLANTLKAVGLLAAGEAAAGLVSAEVSPLADSALRALAVVQRKTVGVVLVLATLVLAGGMVSYHALAARREPPRPAPAPTDEGQRFPRPGKALRGFDEPTVTAWKKAGAQVGWMGKNRFGLPTFDTRPDQLAAAVPAFLFESWQEKLLAGLPHPAVPFGLSFGRPHQITQVTDAGLKELAGHKNLQALILSGFNVTDTGLKELAALNNLQALVLENTNITDAGLKELAALKSLRTLYLPAQVTDVGLKELAGLRSLHTLGLGRTQVTDAGLKGLARLTNLQRLNLLDTRVTDAGLKELTGLKRLQLLSLPTRVTDAGLKELAGLKSLQFLNLSETQVTDAGLQELTGLKGLQLLSLPTRVTDAGLQELRKALPACEIRDR